MARPVQIRDETILDAARDVFLERGMAATTAEVAVRAGVSEGSVFKRFSSKSELFHAALEPSLASFAWFSLFDAPAGDRPFEERLVEIGDAILVHFRRVVPLTMMRWSDRAAPVRFDAEAPALRLRRRMMEFLRGEAAAGRIAARDEETTAQTFIGSIHSFAFFELATAAPQGKGASDAFLRSLAALLWNGLRPSDDRRDGAAIGRGGGRGGGRAKR